MKRMSVVLTVCMAVCALALSACAGSGINRADLSAQQNVFLAGGDIGALFIGADAYQALNDCSAPGHSMPCSTVANNAKVQKAKEDILKGRNKARDLVRTPGFDQHSLDTINLEIQGAIDLITSIIGEQPSAFVPTWLGGAMTAGTATAVFAIPSTAAGFLQLLLMFLSYAKTIFGAGSRMHTFADGVADQVRTMIAEANRNPTDAEWQAQDASLEELVRQPEQAQPPGGV